MTIMKEYKPVLSHNVSAVQATLPVIMTTIDGNDFLVQPGDYVMRGIAGEVYPCKRHVFAYKYEDAATYQKPEFEELRITITIPQWNSLTVEARKKFLANLKPRLRSMELELKTECQVYADIEYVSVLETGVNL